jgi:Ni/Co efflux regulator RcnB
MRTQFRLAALACAIAMMSGPAYADKPTWVDGGKPQKSANGNGKGADAAYESSAPDIHSHAGDVTINAWFDDRDRNILHEYYADEYRSGHCPPGLAKKNNGCMPPGQARKWSIGHRLPDDLIYYDLPLEILRRLGTPPDGYKYVRVAADVLLIAVGTGMVMDAIEDLSGM